MGGPAERRGAGARGGFVAGIIGRELGLA